MTEIDDIIKEISHKYKKKKEPSASHKLVYDSFSEQLEPVYFWILDFMNGMFGGKVEKLTDNFASSPGSGHFGEMGIRKSQMQTQATQLLTTMNTILKSVINLLYDLKEFQIRLTHYDAAKSQNPNKKQAALLSLKQIWMDKVDMGSRGAGSINQLSSGNLQFVTLRDAFLKVDSVKAVDDLDLNDRVKRILKPRIQEFLAWKNMSERELRKRFEIEKTYLKSQVDSLKLQARWAKPYLKAAEQLENKEKIGTDAALVSAFNVLILELQLLAKAGLDIKDLAANKKLPRDFAKMKNLRSYHAVVLVDFKFRTVPSKSGQHYTFGGRADVEFKAYALNDEELALLKYKLEDEDLESSLKLIQGMTDDSLKQLKVDLDEFLGSEEEDKKKQETPETNPFSALFSFLRPEKTQEKAKKEGMTDKEKQIEDMRLLNKKGIKKDNYAEQYLRNFAEAEAITRCFKVFDIYKKAHQMASMPYMEDVEVTPPRTEAEKLFGFNKERGYDYNYQDE
tara:strand:- start:5040 stop:6563 length:1524 start_codon:yes stop_codon:yes gene_type:complete